MGELHWTFGEKILMISAIQQYQQFKLLHSFGEFPSLDAFKQKVDSHSSFNLDSFSEQCFECEGLTLVF